MQPCLPGPHVRKIRLVWLKLKRNKSTRLSTEFNSTRLMVLFFSIIGLTFDNRLGQSLTHVKEIGKTGLLVSARHRYDTSANLEVFDVSRKGKAMKIYSFEEVSGSTFIIKSWLIIIISLATGEGDLTYNSRRSLFGAISVTGRIAYHLYKITTSKAGNNVQLIRKSRWHSQQSSDDGNE